jgi:signal peptidase II
MVSSSWLMVEAIISGVLLVAALVIFLMCFARGKLWMAVALGVALLDQFAKLVIINLLPPGGKVALWGTSKIVYAQNHLLGFGKGDNDLLPATAASILVILLLALRLKKRNFRLGFLAELSCALIVGGFSGILIDRVGRGYVIDWIDFGAWSDFVYNVADLAALTAVVLGAVVLIRVIIKHARKQPGVENANDALDAAGRRAAQALRARYDGLSPTGLAEALGVKIEHRPVAVQLPAAVRVRSEYLASDTAGKQDATVVLYDIPLQELCRLVAAKRPAWTRIDLEQVHIAHELFHHLNAGRPAPERAAHAFTAELMHLDFRPEELDSLYGRD